VKPGCDAPLAPANVPVDATRTAVTFASTTPGADLGAHKGSALDTIIG